MKTNKNSQPLKWVPSLYFAMGLPFVIVNLVAVLMFRDMGIGDAQIAFWTSLIILPWSLKPLWSPILEMFKTKKYFVILTQIASGVLLAMIAFTLQLPTFFPYAIALLGLVAVSGATHDIVADGVYIDELDKQQQAQFIGWQGAFYNLAKVLATGGLVYLAGALTKTMGAATAWSIVMAICAWVLVVVGLYHVKSLPTGKRSTEVRDTSVIGVIKKTLFIIKKFLTKRYVMWYLAFILFYRFAEGFVIKIVPLFLGAPISEQGLGLTNEQIGLYYGTFGVVAFVIGSILGGYFISHVGLKKALLPLCFIFNTPFVIYALLAHFQPESMMLVCSAIVVEYFGYGFGFVGLTLFIMQQISPGEHQMAHYAFGTSLANLGVMLPGMISGYMSDMLGYRDFFAWALLAAVPTFIICALIPFKEDPASDQ